MIKTLTTTLAVNLIVLANSQAGIALAGLHPATCLATFNVETALLFKTTKLVTMAT